LTSATSSRSLATRRWRRDAGDATLANAALTLVGGGSAGLNGDGATLSGDAGLTLAATTAITFAPAVGTPGVFGPAITAATSLTLDGSIGGYAGGQVDITAGSGDWVNNGTISTVAGEFLMISTGGTFGGTGKLSLVSGSFLDVASNISVAGFNQFALATGAGIGLGGNLTGGSAPGDSTVTIPVGTSFSASFRSTLKDVTIDANGTVGSIAATLDGVTWRGVALDVENTAETDVEGGLVVTSADGGTGTIDLGGTNSILAILDSETLDDVAIDIGSSSTTPASDSISVLSAQGASITFGAKSTVNLTGNDAFNGIVANHVSAYGTFDIDTNAPNFGTPTGTIPFIGVTSFFNNGLLSVGQSVAASNLQTAATGGATHSYDDTLLFCQNIEGSFGTLENFDIDTYLQELVDFYINSPLGTSPFGGGKLTLAPAVAPASTAGISAATFTADETTIDGTGTIAISSIGSFFDAEIAASQHIVFAGPHAEVGFGEPGDMQAVISNFGSLDGIDLALDGYVGGHVSYAGGVLMVPTAAGSISLNLAFATGVSAAEVVLADDGEGGTAVYVACFAEGTRIATARGAVVVERLRSGDHVRTASGRLRPVVWTGHRRIDCTRHPRPHDVLPVRVQAHAFGYGMPTDDVRLSPDHAVFIDGVLIPVRYLLNDTTIVQSDAAGVTYWHVELDAHDVLLAEGLPCESYLDTGNRSAFAGGSELQLHPDFSRQALDIWNSTGCAPLARDGAELEAARSHLLERAEALGHVATADAGLHLLADGVPLAPASRDGSRYRFTLPRPARRLRLVSRAAVPARMAAYHPDHRGLGVMVVDAAVNGVALDLAALGDGWHAAEERQGAVWRWTGGNAALPAHDAVTVEIVALPLPTGYWESMTI
jgi:hypothetical protein